jgi:hypothetical protein
VVGQPGGDIGVAGHARHVDRHAEHLQGAWVHQLVAGDDVEQLMVELGRQPGGVGVPRQDVERRRLAAGQVVVHPVVPHQVVWAQPGEDLGHLPALKYPFPARRPPGQRERWRGSEEQHLRIDIKVEQGDDQGRRVDPVIGQGREAG